MPCMCRVGAMYVPRHFHGTLAALLRNAMEVPRLPHNMYGTALHGTARLPCGFFTKPHHHCHPSIMLQIPCLFFNSIIVVQDRDGAETNPQDGLLST